MQVDHSRYVIDGQYTILETRSDFEQAHHSPLISNVNYSSTGPRLLKFIRSENLLHETKARV